MDIEANLVFVFKGIGLLLIFLVLIFFVGFVIFLLSSIKKANKKSVNEPIQIDDVLVVTKRSRYVKVTSYYVTFQFLNGERKEFLVTGKDYGMIAENDGGKLKYQGENFISFTRE